MRLILLLFFLFLSTPLWAMGHVSKTLSDSPLIGQKAPDVVLSKTDGASSGVIHSRDGKNAILVFWATWCPHCYEELGFINDHIALIEQKGIKVILVDVGESKEDVINYLNKRQLNLTSFVDEMSFLQDVYHLRGVPTMIFIDKKGIIRNETHQFPSDYENFFDSSK